MNTESFLAHEQCRMEAYRLLADCYQLPDQNLKENLIRLSSNMKTVCGQASEYVCQMKKNIEQINDSEHLKVDYAKLFVGPYRLLAAPYGSVYLEGERTVMGESTVDAQHRYREAGLDIAKDFNEAPDHIAAELEFMYVLILNELEGISTSDEEKTIGSLHQQNDFLQAHLGAWVPDFVQDVERNAQTSFYRNLARATKLFIMYDIDQNPAFSGFAPSDFQGLKSDTAI
jgi:TorA maturation chaperone TorD